MLTGKKILLCVSGGIAVYKACALTSKLTQLGATVKVAMTDSATKFVAPLTFQALSRQPVYIDTFEENDPQRITHIDLADWADFVIIAPATANIIGKLANGIADDLVSTLLLAQNVPVFVAPAMNVHMYDHPAVSKNMKTLASFGYEFLEPEEGYLACGYVGKGRLMEPEQIIEKIESWLEKQQSKPLSGVKMLVTAGPTIEKIDPVRYISNPSSGKMGYAIVQEAVKRGADVTLVSGPTHLEIPTGVTFVQVESAMEMYNAVIELFEQTNIVIKTAAVADYTPKVVVDQKMKKQSGDIVIEMERTKDILQTLGNKKSSNQLLVGFAAETDQVDAYAKEKLAKKNLDMIVANDLTSEGAGFIGDTNIVTIYKKDGTNRPLSLLSKQKVAERLLDEIEQVWKER